MAYKLIIANHAEELLDEIIHHLIFRLKTARLPHTCLTAWNKSIVGWKTILSNFLSARILI